MRRLPSLRQQYGFTVVEVLVAMVIGVILLLGVINIFNAGKESYTLQNAIARLEENARFAFLIMSRSITIAGYEGASNTNVLPFNLAGTAEGADSDSIAVNYMTATIDCLGNPTAANVVNTDNFAIGLTGLTCKGAVIVRGITDMEIVYGQDDTKHPGQPQVQQMKGIPDRYLPFNQVTQLNDMSEDGGIATVRITLQSTSISEVPGTPTVTRSFTRTIVLRNYGNRPKHPVY